MQERQKIGEFVHIPKTAGTSVRSAIEHNVGPEGVYIYSPQVDRLVPSSSNLLPQTSNMIEAVRWGITNPLLGPLLLRVYPLIDSINKGRIRKRYPNLEIPDKAKVIFGHFSANKFDELLTHEPIRGVIIRDPLERMRSHYDHWKRNKGKADWGIDVQYDSNMTFEQFALLSQLQNYQTQALAGMDIHTFDVVGITEDTEEFIQTFLGRLRQEGLINSEQTEIHQRRLNTTSPRRKTPTQNLDQKFLELFRQFHSEDYDLYEKAKEIYTVRTTE